MSHRLFWLENSSGSRTGLNGENGLWLLSPTGLGINYKTEYSDISKGFFYKGQANITQGTFVGELHFGTNPYSAFQTFVNWLDDDMTLIYCPYGSSEYKRKVDIEYITKTELDRYGRLICPISFKYKTPWFTDETLAGTGTVNVTAGGQIGSAIVLTTTGTALTNPVITLTDTDGVFALVSIIQEFSAADALEYSNLYDDSHIYGVIGGVGTDLISQVNINNELFAHSNKAYSVEVSGSPSISVKVRRYWNLV